MQLPREKFFNAGKYLLFLAIGIALFAWVYKDLGMEEITQSLHEINYFWLLISFLLGILSHISRAIRWNMLIRPLGYSPRVINSFLSVMIMYLVNLMLPRAGEVARCSVLTKYEKAPFTKLVGTVVIERITDVIALAFFATIILLSQIWVIDDFMAQNPEVNMKLSSLLSPWNIAGVAFLAFSGLLFFFWLIRRMRNGKMNNKLGGIIRSFIEGIKTLKQLENGWAYLGHTVFIYIMWLIMLYVVFYAYPPTEHLGIGAGMVAFVMGGLAMIAPVQGGIGAWHFMVIQTLVIFGIAQKDAGIFALIAHTTTNLSLMIMGLIGWIILPFINKNYQPAFTPPEATEK